MCSGIIGWGTPAPLFHYHHVDPVYGWRCTGDQVIKATGCLDKGVAQDGGYYVRAFAEALEVIPYIVAENVGFNSITIIIELRNHHAQGEINVGLHVEKRMHQGSDSNDVVFPRRRTYDHVEGNEEASLGWIRMSE